MSHPRIVASRAINCLIHGRGIALCTYQECMSKVTKLIVAAATIQINKRRQSVSAKDARCPSFTEQGLEHTWISTTGMFAVV